MKHYYRITTGLCTFLCLIIMLTVYSQSNSVTSAKETPTKTSAWSNVSDWFGNLLGWKKTESGQELTKENNENNKKATNICKIILENEEKK